MRITIRRMEGPSNPMGWGYLGVTDDDGNTNEEPISVAAAVALQDIFDEIRALRGEVAAHGTLGLKTSDTLDRLDRILGDP